jgi:hypothetical protein
MAMRAIIIINSPRFNIIAFSRNKAIEMIGFVAKVFVEVGHEGL